LAADSVPRGEKWGEVSGVDDKNAQISFVLRERGDVKGDFPGIVIAGDFRV
jgi:hypothetical protein